MTWLVAQLSDDDRPTENRLAMAGHETCVPRYRATIPGAGGRAAHEVWRPLLPGYLFIRHTLFWPALLQVRGVSRLLGWTGDNLFLPHVVADEIVEELAARGAPPDDTEVVSWPPGAIVRVIAGPHQGLIGRVDDKPPRHGRTPVVLDYLGAHRIVWIPTRLLGRA